MPVSSTDSGFAAAMCIAISRTSPWKSSGVAQRPNAVRLSTLSFMLGTSSRALRMNGVSV